MKILFITPYAPTPIRTRPYNFIRELVKIGHEVLLATVWENESEKRILDQLAGIGVKVIGFRLSRSRIILNLGYSLIINRPLQSQYSFQPLLANKIARLLGDYYQDCDIIHLEHLRGAIYGLHIKNILENSQSPIPIIWDSVDNISTLFEQAAQYSQDPFGKFVTQFELPRTRKYEQYLLTKFERVLVASQLDKEAFDRLYDSTLPRTKIDVVTNGVDLEKFSPGSASRKQDSIVFSGKLSYHANIASALFLLKEVMPIVWQSRPSVTVTLVGKDPHRSLINLAVSDPRIQVTGTVPELQPFLASATVAAATLRYGAGVQNKVLEAMACGIPVVATSQAISALQVIPGRDLITADDTAGIANGILNLLGNQNLQKIIGENGRNFVLTHHSWSKVTEKLIDTYEDVIKRTHDNRSARKDISPLTD